MSTKVGGIAIALGVAALLFATVYGLLFSTGRGAPETSVWITRGAGIAGAAMIALGVAIFTRAGKSGGGGSATT